MWVCPTRICSRSSGRLRRTCGCGSGPGKSTRLRSSSRRRAITIQATESGGARPNVQADLRAFLDGGVAFDNSQTPTSRLAPQVGNPPVDVAADTLFLLGTTVVTFRFSDASGNIGSAASTVTVVPFAGGTLIDRGGAQYRAASEDGTPLPVLVEFTGVIQTGFVVGALLPESAPAAGRLRVPRPGLQSHHDGHLCSARSGVFRGHGVHVGGSPDALRRRGVGRYHAGLAQQRVTEMRRGHVALAMGGHAPGGCHAAAHRGRSRPVVGRPEEQRCRGVAARHTDGTAGQRRPGRLR